MTIAPVCEILRDGFETFGENKNNKKIIRKNVPSEIKKLYNGAKENLPKPETDREEIKKKH